MSRTVCGTCWAPYIDGRCECEQPKPPPEAQTEAEKVAYAAGWGAALEQMRRQPKFTLSCGCPSQYGGVPAYWERDGSTAFGMICEKHWHEYDARAQA
jgi:hypothetical protein